MPRVQELKSQKSLVKTCTDLLKPGGHLFLSTINKNPRSWITAIVGAEYIFNLLPKGTHEFDKFIKPSSLASYVRDANAKVIEKKGMFLARGVQRGGAPRVSSKNTEQIRKATKIQKRILQLQCLIYLKRRHHLRTK